MLTRTLFCVVLMAAGWTGTCKRPHPNQLSFIGVPVPNRMKGLISSFPELIKIALGQPYLLLRITCKGV